MPDKGAVSVPLGFDRLKTSAALHSVMNGPVTEYPPHVAQRVVVVAFFHV